MKRPLFITAVVVTVAALAACSEKPQTLGGVKGDVAAYQGVDTPYAAPGWKRGDRTSWEQGLKARAQNTQNEYSKTISPK